MGRVEDRRGPCGGPPAHTHLQHGRRQQIWAHAQAAQGAHGEPGQGGCGKGEFNQSLLI